MDSSPAPANYSEDTSIYKESHFYEDNDDFLLRYTIIKKNNINNIKFDALNTKIISDLMYSDIEEIGQFKNKIGLKDDNYDLYTYLTFEFKNFPPQFVFDERTSSVKINVINKENKYNLVLKEGKCNDSVFKEKNINKKLNQLERKLEKKYSEFLEVNKKLNTDNNMKRDELTRIQEKNKNIAIINEKLSKVLNELEKNQKKVIEQLNEVS